MIGRISDGPMQHHVFYKLLWRCFIVLGDPSHIRAKAVGARVEPAQPTYSFPPERPDDEGAPFRIEPSDGVTVAYVKLIASYKDADCFVETAIASCEDCEDVRFPLAGQLACNKPFVPVPTRSSKRLAARCGSGSYGTATMCRGRWFRSTSPRVPSNTVVEAKQVGTVSVVSPPGALPKVTEFGRDGFVCHDHTMAVALREELAYCVDAKANLVREAGVAARASLDRLCITKTAFARA